MKKIRNATKVVANDHHLMRSEPDEASDQNDKSVSFMLENFAINQIKLEGLNEEDKVQKLEKAVKAVKIFSDSLGAKGLLQNMLATQLLGLHDLQQRLLSYASRSISYPEGNQYYVNAITKLSNTFVNQVNLLQKLQGQGQQKVVVEHLHIDRAQAMVGNVSLHVQGGQGSEK